MRRLLRALAAPPRAVVARLAAAAGAMTDQELVAIAGLGLLGTGLGAFWLPLGLIVPGAILVLIALGFTLGRTS